MKEEDKTATASAKRQNYKVGDKLVTTQQEIRIIFGQTPQAGVYLTTDNQIRWEYYAGEQVPKYLEAAISHFETLASTLKNCVPKKRWDNSILELGYSLRSAMNASEASEALSAFKDVEEALLEKSKTHFSFRYLLGSILMVMIIIIPISVITKIYPSLFDIFWCGGLGGAMGALLSVLLRIRDLSNVKIGPLWNAAIQGGSRTLLGFIFGAIIVLSMKADIILGVVKDNLYTSAILAIVAGFSERLVPELLQSLEERQAAKIKSDAS